MQIDASHPFPNLLPAFCMDIGLAVAAPVLRARTLGGASGPAGDATKIEKCGTAWVKSIMVRKQYAGCIASVANRPGRSACAATTRQ